MEEITKPEPPAQPTPEAPVPKPSKHERTMEFWRRNQIILIHFPLLVAASFGIYVLLKGLDPRIGLEGFGDIFGYILNAIRAALIIFNAWWFKRWAWSDIRRRVEHDLFEAARLGDVNAKWLLVKDRIEWVAVLCLFTYLFTR
jgi:hypothetical protein